MTVVAAESTTTPGMAHQHDVAIVGSGFSGLAMAVRLREEGIESFVVLERGDDVGGTWRDNSYPGCACDVPSHLYSLSFAPNPGWSSTFSPQGEIHAYLRDVAQRHGVLPHVRFGCELQGAEWDEHQQRWHLETSAGLLSARVLIVAAGPLSEPSVPRLPGIERFTGTTFHSAAWEHDHDLTGKRVAVIGTGASAIQFVPRIQPRVARLHLFQRTAPWVLPRRARRLSRLERAVYRRLPVAQRLMRAGIYWARELYAVPLLRASLAPLTKRLGRSYLRRQVPDPDLRRKLTPSYAPGCKRILISNDYLPSLAKPNVDLVTDGIAEVRERSIVTTDGTEHDVDTIIFGTGFRVTDFPIAHTVRGRGGRLLADVWQGSPRAHRGATVAGFPNMFFLLGPNTGLGHTSVVVMAEAQAGYVMEALRHMRSHVVGALEVRAEAQEAWNAELQRAMRGTVWTAGGCASWYIDSTGKNTTLWPGFTFRFRRLLRRFDAQSYVCRPATAASAGVPTSAPSSSRTPSPSAPCSGTSSAPASARSG
jgi:cation diffusion facilitator CzcD-associated flavoprotein CzcO